MALYALADCLARLGETDEARRRAGECRRPYYSRGDELAKVFDELLEKPFPERKGGKRERVYFRFSYKKRRMRTSARCCHSSAAIKPR
jgi:hypothetical protein